MCVLCRHNFHSIALQAAYRKCVHQQIINTDGDDDGGHCTLGLHRFRTFDLWVIYFLSALPSSYIADKMNFGRSFLLLFDHFEYVFACSRRFPPSFIRYSGQLLDYHQSWSASLINSQNSIKPESCPALRAQTLHSLHSPKTIQMLIIRCRPVSSCFSCSSFFGQFSIIKRFYLSCFHLILSFLITRLVPLFLLFSLHSSKTLICLRVSHWVCVYFMLVSSIQFCTHCVRWLG